MGFISTDEWIDSIVTLMKRIEQEITSSILSQVDPKAIIRNTPISGVENRYHGETEYLETVMVESKGYDYVCQVRVVESGGEYRTDLHLTLFELPEGSDMSEWDFVDMLAEDPARIP